MQSGSMPIVVFDKGSLFTLKKESFQCGSSLEDFGIFSCSSKTTRAYFGTYHPKNSLPSEENTSYAFVPYHYCLTFEKNSIYFAIPYSLISTLISNFTKDVYHGTASKKTLTACIRL